MSESNRFFRTQTERVNHHTASPLFVIPKIDSTVGYWTPKVEKTYLAMTDYWQSFSIEIPDDPIDFVAFVPQDQELTIGTEPKPIDQYPQGTGVFPLSSGWTDPTGQWLG